MLLLPALLVAEALLSPALQGKMTAAGRPYTALVTAYDPEIEALIQLLEARPDHAWTRDIERVGVRFKAGRVGDRPILVFATQMSIANAAMSMQIALDHFAIERVLYAGIAGGVNPELEKGDVVVPARWFYHDESAYFNPDPDNPGAYIVADYFRNSSWFYPEHRPADPHLPDYDNFGMIFPDDVLIVKPGRPEPFPISYFSATPALLDAAREVGDALADRDFRLDIGGNAVTGSVFVDNADYRRWLRRVWRAEVTEMESAAVGQVCEVNGVPWVIVRGVSDLAGGQEGKNEENLYDSLASEHAGAVLLALLDRLPAPDPAAVGAARWMDALGLRVLPKESGYFTEVFRSDLAGAGSGDASSAIYYALDSARPINYLHHLEHDDIQVLIDGGPAEFFLFHADGSVERRVLGRDLAAGQQPMIAAPGGTRKAIRLLPEADHMLVGSVVTPGWTAESTRIGAGAAFVERYAGAAPWATPELLRALIGPNFSD